MTIQTLFEQLLTRLPGPVLCGVFEAVREVQGVICNRLLMQKSALLIKMEDAEIDYGVGENIASLPRDFITLASRPYVAGNRPLSPLGSSAVSALVGTPKYFNVVGRALRISPPPSVATVVLVPYFYKPPILTAMTETLPFEGEFDSVFLGGCVALMSQGLAVVADPAFVALIQSQVDSVLTNKNLWAEQLEADAINDGV